MNTDSNTRPKNESNPSRAKTSLALAALLLVPAATGLAQTLWSGGTSDFNNPASWSGTYIGGSNPNCSNDSGTNNFVLIQPGDVVWQHGDTLAGNGANTSGSYLQTGSTNNTGGGNWLRMALGTGSYGQYILSNGVVNVGGQTHIGEYGVGYLEIDGGIFNGNANDGGANPGLAVGDADFGPSPIGTMVVNGGVITIPRETWFGEANSGRIGTGNLVMHGGTLTLNDWFVFGRFGGIGYGYMDGGTINKANNGNVQFGVNSPAQAGFTQVGGVFNCGSEYQVAASGDNTVNVTNNIGGTAVLTVDNWFGVGRAGGYGTLNISGTAVITKTGVHGGNVTIGGGGGSGSQNAVSYGIVNQSGGSFTNTATQTWIGETGTGFWNLNSGTAVFGVVYLGANSGAIGTLNLNGGNLTASEIKANGGSGTLNLNGGTLHAGGSVNPLIHDLNGSALVLAGGVTIDSAGFNVLITQPLWDGGGGGGLTKTGNGTLTLSGANNYSGATLVNAGTLATTTASFANGATTVADGAGFGVQVVSANAQYNPTSLTLGTAAGTTLNLDLGSFGNPTLAPLNVTGNLAANGTITINIADGLPQVGPQFPLIKYGTKSGAGTFTLGTLPTGMMATLVDNPGNNSIDLNITSVNLPKWDGEAGGNWDIGLTTNWVNAGTGLPTYFSQGSAVLFDDSALGTTTVNLVTTVNPTSVAVNDSALSYAFTGSGKISGATGLAKQGTGTLTITNTGGNNYTGPTVISDGVVSVTSLANGGSPSAIGASSSGATNLVLAGGTLSYAGPAVAINRGYTVQTTNGTIETVSNLTLSGAVTATANGGFIKAGDAQLAYTTAGTNLLSAPGSDGYIVESGTVLFDGSSGGQTNTIAGNRLGVDAPVGTASMVLTNTTLNTGGNVDLGNVDNTTGLLTVNNGSTLNVGGWLILADGLNSVGTLTLNGGTLNINSGNLLMGGHPGTTTTLNINGGVLNKSGGTVIVAPGNWNADGPRTGTINQTGGTFALSDEIQLGQIAQGEGFYNLHGGTVNSTSWFVIGRAGGSGTMIMDGGILNHTTSGQPAFIVGSGAGDNGVTSVGFLDQSGGTINCTSEYWVAENTLTVATNNISGTAAVNVGNWVSLGRGGQAVINFSGGTFTKTGGGNFIVGDGGNAIWNQTGGTLTSSGEIWVGQSGGATGLFELSAGSVTGSNWVAVGRQGATGTLNVSGGSFTKLGDNSNHITVGSGGPGTVNQIGGTITSTLSDTFIGEGGQPGIWNMNGGAAVLGLVDLPINSGANGTLNLNGGTFTATQVTSGNAGGTGTLNFNGGTLIAGNGASANFLHDLTTANVMSGGAIIDSGNNIVSVNQALLDGTGGGGLTKLGTGTLRLNGVNTYTGPTLVNAGTLGGTGTLAGPLTVAGIASLAPGAPIGTLTVNNSATLGATTVIAVSRDGGVPASGRLAVSGNLGFAGALNVVLVGTNGLAVNDTFTLFTWSTRSGSLGPVTLPPGYFWDTSQLNVNGTIRVVGVTPPQVQSTKVVGGNLVLTGVGGPAGASYTWLTSTNAAAPVATWTTNSTGVFDSNSAFSNAIPINTSVPARFFRLKTP